MDKSVKNPLKFIRNMFSNQRLADVSVVLNIWKRHYLEEQLEALSQQTVQPAQIWILHAENHKPEPSLLKDYSNIHYIHSSFNLKYFWRFSIVHHFKTAYTWVLDDDIIPGKFWIERALDICDRHNAIVASNGRIIPHNNFFPEKTINEHYWVKYFIGDRKFEQKFNTCQEDTFVDFGCSSYFFKTSWLNHFWSIQPQTIETGEDMHLSATCAIRAGIPTIVPRQMTKNESGNIKPDYSADDNASWKQNDFFDKRSKVLKYLIEENKWTPLLWRQQEEVLT